MPRVESICEVRLPLKRKPNRMTVGCAGDGQQVLVGAIATGRDHPETVSFINIAYPAG